MNDQPLKTTAHLVVSLDGLLDGADMHAALHAAMQSTTQAQRQAALETHRATTARQLAAAQARHDDARAGLTGTLLEVLDLHGPRVADYGFTVQCDGCDWGGPEAEAAEWPCTTWTLIAKRAALTAGR